MNTLKHHHRTFFAGITLFLSFFSATAFGQPGALTPALVKTVRQCTQIGSFHEGMAVACKNGRYGYIRRDGSWVVKPKYEMAFDFSEGRGAVVKNRRLGFVDSTGKEVIACAYDYDDERRMWLDVYPYAFHNGMMVVELHGDDGVIDRNGKVRVPFGIYNFIWNFEDGVAFARIGHPVKDSVNRYQLVDTNGNVVFNIPDPLYVGPLQGSGGRCLGASVHVIDTADSYYGVRMGYMDMKGRVVLPPQYHGRGMFDSKRWFSIHENVRLSADDGDTSYDIYHCLYDLILQKEVPLSSEVIFRFMDSCYNAPVFAEGKCFVNKEVDGKKRVVVQDSSGRELCTLPLGVYDCQPWSEGLSVVRLKDGQHFRYGLMDGEGKLSFTAEQLREAERIAMAQSRLSWPALQLDSQTVEGLVQLLEEAYQEKSEEKKQLFFRRCAELAESLRRTDNDTLREVEELFKVFGRSQDWRDGTGMHCYLSDYLQAYIPHICFILSVDDLEKEFIKCRKHLGSDDYYDDVYFYLSNFWDGRLEPERFVICRDSAANFCPQMEEYPQGFFGLPVFRQIKKRFINEEPYLLWDASEEYWNRTHFINLYPAEDMFRVGSIVFGKGMKQVMVFYDKYYDYHQCERGYCLLKKKGGVWKVIRQVPFGELHRD